jgi:hypothetical protein
MENKVALQITHEVKNFEEWKKGFDADESNRASMGVKITGVYTSIENPNLVTVMSEVPSVESAKGFLSNPELKAIMEKAGVISTPEIKLLFSQQ